MMVHLKKILITTDLSEFSLAALEHARSFALLYGAHLYILYVADKLPSVMALGGISLDEQQYQGRAREEAEQALATFVKARIGGDIPLTQVVRYGIPEEEIRLFAEQERIDLIVMATHGHTGLKYILMGSVAEKVVRQSNVPVLAVKPSRLHDSLLSDEDVEHDLHLP